MTIKAKCLSLSLVVLVATGVILAATRHAPRYLWLLFGPEQKVRLLACVQGTSLSIDHNGDGKFQGKDEVFASFEEAKGVSILDPGGTTTYVIQRVSEYHNGEDTRYMIHMGINGKFSYQEYCDIGWSGDPITAPSANFHAPLTIALQRPLDLTPSDQSLRRGDKPADIRVNISTIDKKTGCWVVVRTEEMFKPGYSVFPVGVHPFLDAEYPPIQPGKPSIRQRYPLDRACCGSLFHGLVRVPDDVGDGKVKLTISFDTWPAGHVPPNTIEVPLMASND